MKGITLVIDKGGATNLKVGGLCIGKCGGQYSKNTKI